MVRICWFIVALTFADACACRATLIADWNFNYSSGSQAAMPMAASHGAGSLDLPRLSSGSDASIGSSGTAVNKFTGDVAGSDFYIQGGTKNDSGYPENGKSVVFSVSMSGYQKLLVTYATFGTSSGFSEQDWSYSTDNGASYTLFKTFGGSSEMAIPAAYAIETVDFSSVTALDNSSSVLFELTLNGATGANGSDHFDNIQFNAGAIAPVPEPAAAGAIAGVGLLALCALRIWRQRSCGEKLKS
jgi:hypothetical protein